MNHKGTAEYINRTPFSFMRSEGGLKNVALGKQIEMDEFILHIAQKIEKEIT